MDFLFQNTKHIIHIFVVIAILELFANALWWRIYFKSGLTVFKRTVTVATSSVQLPTAEVLEDAMPELAWRPPLLVRKINEMIYAFRKKMLFIGFSYVPVMHGCIKYDRDTKKLLVLGYANWYVLVFSAIFLLFTVYFIIGSKDLLASVLPAGLLLMIGNGYLTQRRRFIQVAEAMENIINTSI